MAKTGTFTAPSGADLIIRSLGDAAPPQNTLAGMLRDALGVTPLDKIGIINLEDRTVNIVPSGTDISAVTGASGITLLEEFTKDDESKASSPWTDTEDSSLETIVEAAKPSMSVESLANKIEDAFLAQEGDTTGKGGIIVIDQGAGTFKVYHGATATVAALNAAALLVEDARFIQNIAAASGSQFGE